MFRRLTCRVIRHSLLAVSLLLTAPASFAQMTTETQLKAAFLVNFLKYVEWPDGSIGATICLFGRDSLGSQLASYEGRMQGGREIHIRRVSSEDQLQGCQEVFTPAAEEARFALLLKWVDKSPILTISDGEFFARDGGAIALIQGDGRLHFEINAEALNRAGLRANPQMSRLARRIYGLPR